MLKVIAMKFFTVKVPARINILGNPSDANEGAHQTISAAINIWAEAKVEPNEKIIFEKAIKRPSRKTELIELDPSRELKITYGTEFDLLLASLKMLLQFSPELSEKIKQHGFKITFSTEIPRQSGLGGSTVLAHLALLSLVHFYRLDRKKHNLYFLAELTQRIEEKELGITCGFADRYVPLLGDLAYIDYRGKVWHLPIKDEPYCAYEKLGDYVDYPNLVVVYSGLEHQSGDVHKIMRGKYLEELKGWEGFYEKGPFMVRQMKLIGDTAWKGKIALLESDWTRFGELMNENHKLVNEMMRYCGFDEGAGEVNNNLIEIGMKLGALGAKLTGAGRGGSVFYLLKPNDEDRFISELMPKIKELNLHNAQVWVPSIVRQGAVIIDR